MSIQLYVLRTATLDRSENTSGVSTGSLTCFLPVTKAVVGPGGRTYSGANQRTGPASRQRTDAGTCPGPAAYEGKISLFVRSADPGIRARWQHGKSRRPCGTIASVTSNRARPRKRPEFFAATTVPVNGVPLGTTTLLPDHNGVVQRGRKPRARARELRVQRLPKAHADSRAGGNNDRRIHRVLGRRQA